MINPKKWTLKSQITLMIGSLGSISLIFSILIINLYSHQIVNNQQKTLHELISLEIATLEKQNSESLEEFGLNIQGNPIFKKAFKQRDITKLTKLINDEFLLNYKTAQILNVNKILIYDLDYNLVTHSTKGNPPTTQGEVCKGSLEKTKVKTNIKGKAIQTLCHHKGHIFKSTFLPIGSVQPQGYIHIISDPIIYLKNIENSLNLPLKIKDRNNDTIYTTPNWDNLLTKDKLLITHSVFDNDKTTKIFTMTMLRDISQLNQQSDTMKILIIAPVLFVTIISVFIFLYIFNKLMVKPLHALTHQLSLIEEDKSKLGNALPLVGSKEIRQLTARFNTMHDKLADLYNSLEHIAFTDQLTALPNRSQLQNILSFHTTLNKQNDTPFVLFMMDLNHFKSVNDTLGHHAGDYLLQQVSSRLSSVVRKSDYVTPVTEYDSSIYHMDVVARLGGDEFAVVLPAIENVEDARNVAEKVISVMEEPFVIEGNTFSIGMSIGVSICPSHGREAELLMQHADIAMYHAKKNHLDFAIYDIRFEEDRIGSLTLEDDLRKALKNNSLSLAYQPKINLHTNKITGVEVLLRWKHEVHGFISPDKFIPVAEQSTLINEVSRWVISNALKQKREWENKKIDLSFAINISVKNLLCDNFLHYINTQLRELDLDPSSIFLEITETAIMADPASSIITLQELKKVGFMISIDDFGTGYSSLSYLKKLPVDEIKIDRSFVMEMEKDENDAIIVQSTIDLAHNMGLSVTAEGVENNEVLEKLKSRKSDYAQGYYMCKPINSIELEKWLSESEWGIT